MGITLDKEIIGLLHPNKNTSNLRKYMSIKEKINLEVTVDETEFGDILLYTPKDEPCFYMFEIVRAGDAYPKCVPGAENCKMMKCYYFFIPYNKNITPQFNIGQLTEDYSYYNKFISFKKSFADKLIKGEEKAINYIKKILKIQAQLQINKQN